MKNNHSKPTEPAQLKLAVQQARELLAGNHYREAEALGRSLLQSFPGEANSRFILATALRRQGQLQKAREQLLELTRTAPRFPLAFQELALTCEQLQLPAEAAAALKSLLALQPGNTEGWRQLAALYTALGQPQEARDALQAGLTSGGQHPRLLAAVKAFESGELAQAEQLCRAHIAQFPRDVSALRLLADIALQLGVYDDAQQLLERTLAIAPDFHLARINYAHTLAKRELCESALAQLAIVAQQAPDLAAANIEKAAVLVKLGRFQEAIDLYRQLLEQLPDQAKLCNSLGHTLKTIGQREAAERSYRRAIRIEPTNGEAYWSLADLKNYRFSDTEIDAMEALLRQPLADADAAQIHFALGKALEDSGQHDRSFNHYRLGNQLKRQLEAYCAENNSRETDNLIATCRAAELAATQYPGGGCDSAEPIFIVGLPRSGSTLLEQILSSHSLVEGTKELPDLAIIARRLSGRRERGQPSRYAEAITRLNPAQRRELGEEYLARTRIQRGTAPFFIDKMPNNFVHIGLIKQILPNAKIIDARRHPMASCFSCFKQHFASGQGFSYDLTDLGRYYGDYMRLLDHWHQLFPGQILTVHYEQVVLDFEAQVRQLLDYCQLPFEAQCLSFFQNQRAVRTASSEQVRQPIYQSGLSAWQGFAEPLAPLRAALGDCLPRYPFQP